jgi:hypothetical protein
MAKQLYTNNADSTVVGSLTTSSTTIVLATSTGSRFPVISGSDYFLVTLYEIDSTGVEINYEIVQVTARSTDTLTVVRGFDDTTPLAYPSSVAVNPSQVVHVSLRWTAYPANNSLSKDDNLASVQSASTARTNLGLGTISTQNASSVAISGGAINGTQIGNTTRAAISATLELVGPVDSANFTRFPNALSVTSNIPLGIQQNEIHNIGVLGEGVASLGAGDAWGVGVYGKAYTSNNTIGGAKSYGVVGEGHVSATTDAMTAVGVKGYALDTHSGGANVGLYGYAANGATNYALYMEAGDIYALTAQTWTLGGNLTFSGAHTVTIPTLALTNALSIANGGTGATTAAGARTNLGVAASGSDTTYAFRSNNLSDLASVSTARTNLGVTATGADTTYAFRSNNLSDLASVSTARTNLGVTATGADTTYMYRSNNLSDVASVSAAQNNLQVDPAGTAVAMSIALG